MPALVAGIHALNIATKEDVDGRDKPGHDDLLAEFFSVALFYPSSATLSRTIFLIIMILWRTEISSAGARRRALLGLDPRIRASVRRARL
jgi:hypothetical protein